MYVDKKTKIAGQPSIKIRDFLKSGRHSSWTLRTAIARLDTTPRVAIKVLKRLGELGYIEQSSTSGTEERRWKVTSKGQRLALASGAKPILRKTAERKIREFLDRVEIVNNDPHYVYGVKKVVVFGSYLSKREKINDIDLAITLERKIQDDTQYEELCNKSVEEAQKKGRSFSGFFEMFSWPVDEVRLFLKSRSRSLSLHSGDDPALKQARKKTIYKNGKRLL